MVGINNYYGLHSFWAQAFAIVIQPYSFNTGHPSNVGQLLSKQFKSPPVIERNCFLFNFFPLIKF